MNRILIFFALILNTILISCAPEGGEFFEVGSLSKFTDTIIVANNTTKAVVLLDEDGRFLKTLLQLDKTTTDVPWGLALLEATTLLVTVEGVDRIMSTDIFRGESSQSNYLVNGNLSGTMRGITRLTTGDLLIAETNPTERFAVEGSRITSGGWPLTLQTAPTNTVALPGGGFIQCSTTTDVIRAYNDAGAQTATASSGIVNATDAANCNVGPNGEIAVVWQGAGVDTVRVYSSSTLVTTVFSYSNAVIMTNPAAVAFRSNGNVLIADSTNNLIIELTAAGNFVRTISSSAIAAPNNMMVVW